MQFQKREPKDTKVATKEPAEPVDWPRGHVRVELTDTDVNECVRVWIHGHAHYLHSTTARELEKMLRERLHEWNGIARANGFPEV